MKHLNQQEFDSLQADAAEGRRLKALINTAELIDFREAVVLEAVHQRERFGTEKDGGKTPEDWFWLIGYLSGRALAHHKEADRLQQLHDTNFDPNERELLLNQLSHHREKAVHHTITAAAACANWHAAVVGKINMRPGVDPAAVNADAGTVA